MSIQAPCARRQPEAKENQIKLTKKRSTTLPGKILFIYLLFILKNGEGAGGAGAGAGAVAGPGAHAAGQGWLGQPKSDRPWQCVVWDTGS